MMNEPASVIPLEQAREVVREAPRPLSREAAAPEPFPLDALGPLAPGARAIVEHTQAPAALVAQSALGAAALAAQALADVEHPATGAPCPTSLYLFSIGESGERKTAVDALALKPVREREDDLARRFEKELQDYAVEKEIYEAKRDAARSAFKKSDGSAEAEADLRDVGEPPEPPLAPLLICEEPTYEGFYKLAATGRPSLGLFSSEGGAFIGGHGMSQDKRLMTAACLSAVWDGGVLTRVRAGDGASRLPGRRLAIHLMAQPEASLAFLGARDLTDQGLFSRVLTVYPTSTMGARLHRAPSAAARQALERYHRRLGEILALEPRMRDGARNSLNPRLLAMSQAATRMAIAFHDHIERQLAADAPLRPISGMASKAVEHAARVAGVLALFGRSDAMDVGAAEMENAIELVQHYLGEQLRLRALAGIPEALRLAQRLWEWIQTHWTEPAIFASAIYQFGPGTKIRERRTTLATIGILVEHGYLWPIEGGAVVQGARRREAWAIWGREGALC